MEWDFKIGDEITYFDMNKSYELTKYRPITEGLGLDFKPEWFNLAARDKNNQGVYTTAPQGSKAFTDYWNEQIRRCKDGYESNGYRITGNHYFFLNFYKLLSTGKEGAKASSGRDKLNPDFWSKHYEYFHYIELCLYLGFDCCTLKSRGVGFSEIAASIGACQYTVVRNSKTMYIASMEAYLLKNGVLQKVWDCLEDLNQNTEGALMHARMKKNEPLWKRASKVDKKGRELADSFMSEVFGLVVDNPRKLRGTRLDILFFEESGSFGNLTTIYNQSEALIVLNGKRIGTRVLWGTGGDTGPQLAGLEDIFLNPINYNILPYKNCYNEQHETVYTGFFIPAFSCMPIYMDSRGVTNTKLAMDHYMSIRKKKATTPKNLLEYSSEFCFYPQEALSRQGENDFDLVAIANQMATVKIMKELPDTYLKGNFKWIRDDNVLITRSVFVPNPNGRVIMVEPPETDDTDTPLLNLYVAGIDSIDHGEEDSVVGDSGSKFCITIKKRIFGNKGDKYVCMYLERPKSVYTAYEIAALMLFYYGCKGNLEDTKIGFRMWLKTLNLDYKLLMKRPQSALNSGKRNFNLWGTPGSEKMIRHGLELVAKYVEDSCYNIFIEEMLELLLKFSYEAKGRFDIIMAMVYTEIADEDMMGITVRKENAISDQWNEFGDIGFVRDKYGNMQVGIISQM